MHNLRDKFKSEIAWMKNIHHDEYDSLLLWFDRNINHQPVKRVTKRPINIIADGTKGMSRG